MTGFRRRGLAAAAMLAVLQACAVTPEQVVRVEEKDSGRTIELAAGQILEIRLPTFPARGLTISLGSVVTPVLSLSGIPTHNDDTVFDGLGGPGSYEEWRFRAVQPGDAKVRLDYRLQWETTGPPTRSVSYDVVVR